MLMYFLGLAINLRNAHSILKWLATHSAGTNPRLNESTLLPKVKAIQNVRKSLTRLKITLNCLCILKSLILNYFLALYD